MSQDTALPPSGQFRKKPVVIEAWLIDFQNKPLPDWVNEAFRTEVIDWCPAGEGLYINTLEGHMKGDFNDYLIQGVKGELYACKPDIFEATYERAAIAAQAPADEPDMHAYATGLERSTFQMKARIKALDFELRSLKAPQAQGVPREWRSALRKVVFMARTSGGTTGPDSGLMAALSEAEALLSRPYMLAAAPQAEPQQTFTEGHCAEKRKPGGCRLHNLHCGFPACDRKAAIPVSIAEAVPQPERERKPLTLDYIDANIGADEGDRDAVIALVREVEAAHDIGTKGGKP